MDMMGNVLNGRYEITDEIGAGGMGIVYRARDLHTGGEVAIKVLPPALARDPLYLARFEREAQTLHELNHPNIVTYIDNFQEESNYYLVMEYMPGGNLYGLLRREGVLKVEDARRIAIDIADALIRAHRLDIIHRDLKPENILFDAEGNPRLADFGVAGMTSSDEQSRLTGTGVQMGTPHYMSPEAWQAEQLDAQSDIWSLGVVLFEMLSGSPPFPGETAVAVMRNVLQNPMTDIRQIRDDIPDGIYQILRKALAKDKSRRYQSMREVGTDLERGEPAFPLRRRGTLGRGGLLTAILIVILVVIAAAVGFLVLGGSEPDETVLLATTSPTNTPSETPTLTLTPVPTASPTPTLSATEDEATIQALIGGNLTQTATLLTLIPSPNLQLTADARFTQTQIAIFEGLTATVAAWTETPTLTPSTTATNTSTSTMTPSNTPSLTLTPSDIPSSTPTVTQTQAPSATMTSTPNARERAIQQAVTGVSSNADWQPFTEAFFGVEMVLVPAGSFMMGSTEAEIDLAVELCNQADISSNCQRAWFEDDAPTNIQVISEPFWIDRYEVTNEQFGSVGCEEWSSDPEQPRNCVTWFEAKAFCENRGLRLPTEVEWEYTARGPDSLVFPWGGDSTGAQANHCDGHCQAAEWGAELRFINQDHDDGHAETAPVGSYPSGASWVGAMDMAGNVWEWTSTILDTYPYTVDDGREDEEDTSSIRVLRGGSYSDSIVTIRAIDRFGIDPATSDSRYGFRCARSN